MIRFLLFALLSIAANSFCASVNPLDAKQAWEQIMGNREFPKCNTARLWAFSKDAPPIAASCVIVGPYHVLSATHCYHPGANIVVGIGDPLPKLPYNNDVPDLRRLWETYGDPSQNVFLGLRTPSI